MSDDANARRMWARRVPSGTAAILLRQGDEGQAGTPPHAFQWQRPCPSRSTRSVCANLTKAWRKRRYPAAFVAKLSDAEGEAAETQTWLQFAVECGYLDRQKAKLRYTEHDAILGMIVTMVQNPENWTIPKK